VLYETQPGSLIQHPQPGSRQEFCALSIVQVKWLEVGRNTGGQFGSSEVPRSMRRAITRQRGAKRKAPDCEGGVRDDRIVSYYDHEGRGGFGCREFGEQRLKPECNALFGANEDELSEYGEGERDIYGSESRVWGCG
jgi:hypothetical protein